MHHTHGKPAPLLADARSAPGKKGAKLDSVFTRDCMGGKYFSLLRLYQEAIHIQSD
jgi:hypothetical protein